MKFVTITCDNCGKTFLQDIYWTPEFEMDTGTDLCINCRILKGQSI